MADPSMAQLAGWAIGSGDPNAQANVGWPAMNALIQQQAAALPQPSGGNLLGAWLNAQGTNPLLQWTPNMDTGNPLSAGIAPQQPTAVQYPNAMLKAPTGDMWQNWPGFDTSGAVPSGNYTSTPPGGPTPEGFMSYADAKNKAMQPGMNPFPFYDPSHPMWTVMFNQYTNNGQTDPAALFAGLGGATGGGYGSGGTG